MDLIVLLIIVAGLIVTSYTAYIAGHGRFLSKEELIVNYIYETIGVVPIGDGKNYAVILKRQDDSIAAYLIDQNPPKAFKVTEDPKNPYQPYPPQ